MPARKDKVQRKQVAVVVNDEATQLALLSGLLSSAGLKVHSFLSAEEALDALVSIDAPDIIVTDIYMPVIDGWRFCQLLRSPEYESLNEIPILVVSAVFSGNEVVRITNEIGADSFMPAPVDGEKFIARVRELLAGKTHVVTPTVLLVDDDKLVSSLLKKHFTSHGYRVQTAVTGEAAREAFSKIAFDVVILDYYLPNMLGDVLLKEFLDQRPDTVCIMITTDTRPDLALDWTRNGAAAYIQKPFRPEYLVEVCENACRQRALIRVPDLLEERTRQLQESEERFRNMADLLSEPIFETNLKGVLTFVNRQAYNVFGFTKRDFKKGILASDMITPDQRTHAANNARKVLNGENLGASEYEALRKDGSTFPVLISSVAVLSGDEPVGIRGVIIDISERKKTEEQIKAQSQELLEKNAELERFSYTISHDLNSPLITIKAFVKALLSDVAAGRHDRLATDLTRIGSAADSMGQLLVNLLLLSRVGRTVSQPIDVDMNRVVHGTLALLAGPIAECRATIGVIPELPHIRGDRQRIAEVVQNLVENALKYMGGQAEPFIEIGVESVEAEEHRATQSEHRTPNIQHPTSNEKDSSIHSQQSTVNSSQSPVFYVRDNGIGIEPQNLKRVFDLFDKLDLTTKGPGIGLSLVKRIVQAHGGKIWAESKGLGKGSTFKFTLPGVGA